MSARKKPRGWRVKHRRAEAAGGGGSFAPRRANVQRRNETSVTAPPLPARIRTEKPIYKRGNAESLMLASRVDDLKDLRERAAEMRASSKELKEHNTAL